MTPTSSRRHAWTTEAATAAVLVALGAAYGALATREGIGSLAEPRAGFFPVIVAVVLVASGVVVLVQELRANAAGAAPLTATRDAPGAEDDGETGVESVAWARVLGVLAASLAVPLVGDTLGFVTTLSIAVVVMGKVMGMSGLLRPLALGAAFGVVTWLVFVYWLFVPLPAGGLGLA